jgi:hypothetical protein
VFIPMLPACMMEDLAAAFMGELIGPWIYTGLRPGGEKRHELLMSGEEAVRAVDLTGVSIVLPHLATWREKSRWDLQPKAAPVLRSSQFAEQLSVRAAGAAGDREGCAMSTDVTSRRRSPARRAGGHISIKSLATTMRPLKCAAARSIHI